MDINKGENSQIFDEITIRASVPIYTNVFGVILLYDWEYFNSGKDYSSLIVKKTPIIKTSHHAAQP